MTSHLKQIAVKKGEPTRSGDKQLHLEIRTSKGLHTKLSLYASHALSALTHEILQERQRARSELTKIHHLASMILWFHEFIALPQLPLLALRLVSYQTQHHPKMRIHTVVLEIQLPREEIELRDVGQGWWDPTLQ